MVGYVTDCLAFNGGSVIIGCGMDVGEEVSGEREGLLERPSSVSPKALEVWSDRPSACHARGVPMSLLCIASRASHK